MLPKFINLRITWSTLVSENYIINIASKELYNKYCFICISMNQLGIILHADAVVNKQSQTYIQLIEFD